jgi:DNA-directed RNA polymerase specialized sigma24 family protein
MFSALEPLPMVNRIIDEVRRVSRRPILTEIDAAQHEIPSDGDSPLELAARTFESYRAAIETLRTKDRELIAARVELQWPFRDIARRFGFATTEGARIAVSRALKKLMAQMNVGPAS